MAYQWFALERGDGCIERIIDKTSNHMDFGDEVAKRWRRGLAEWHIWISVAAKLRKSRFTRVQRLSCCLSVLLTSMFANAMFYKLEGKYEQPIQVGPLKMSWRQVVTGIESALLVTPINIVIVFLFQKGAEKSATNNDHCLKGTLISGVAWCLLCFSCTVSAAFSIFYSLIWEKSVSEQWLSSMLISFAQEVTIKEPIKVFLTALTFATIFKIKAKKLKVHACESPQQVKTGYYKKHFWALQLSEVEEMRRRQAKKQNLTRYFKELGLYLVFVFLLMAVCYGNRNDHRYLMTKSIRDGLPNFGKVTKHYLIMINPLLRFACLIYLMTFLSLEVKNQVYVRKFYFASLFKSWNFFFLFTDVQGLTKAFFCSCNGYFKQENPFRNSVKEIC